LSGKLVRVLKEYEPAPLPVNLVYPHSRLMSPRVRTFVDWAVPRLRELLVINTV
jgi:DNA-binding transcriptional LysR family regulator